MKVKESLMLYSDKQIIINDDDIFEWVKYLISHNVDFYMLIDRNTNECLKICTNAEDADKYCQKLSRHLDTDVIFEYMENRKWQMKNIDK